MNENDYLDLVNQLKKKFDENEMKVNIFIKQNIKLKKHIMAIYGICKMTDVLDDLSDPQEKEVIYSYLIEYIQNVIDKEILSCPCPNINISKSSELIEVDI